MKHLNFLSTIGKAPLESSSSDIGRRYRVVTDFLPSFCRVNMLKFVSILAIILTIGVGQMWGTVANYTCTSTSGTIVSSKITWTTSNATWNSPQCRMAANSNISFTLTGVNVTKVVMGMSSSTYVGDWSAASGSIGDDGDKTVTWEGTAGPGTLTFTTSAAARLKTIAVTYTDAASYTVVWTINPAAGGTLSTTSGNSTTVTPDDAYTYDSPAYTVTSGTASVLQSTNTFTATPTANCTIRINMVEKPKYKITYNAGTGSCETKSWTQTVADESTTLPTATTTCTGWTFAGWCTSSAGDAANNTTSPGTILKGSYTPTGDITLYAVYTKSENSSTPTTESYGFESTDDDTNWEFSGVEANTGYHKTGSKAGKIARSSTGNSTITFKNKVNVTAFSFQFMRQTTNNNYNVYIETSTDKSSWSAVETYAMSSFTSAETWYAKSHDLDGKTALYVRIKCYTTSAIRWVDDISITYTGGSTTYYMTSLVCCSPLGSINGSFKCTSNSASARVFSWDNEETASDVDHYELSYKEKDASGNPTTIKDDITNSTSSYTHTANLTEGTTYTYYLKAVGASGHCDATEEVDVLIPYATSTVTFNDNGKTSGSVPADITQNTGTTVTVPGNTGSLVKTNYAFGGWNTKDDGTGINYVADATFTLSNDITLYAKWNCAKKVTLTKGTPSNGSFNLSEADGDKYTCDAAVVVTVSNITPSAGYRLVGITQTGMESGVTIDQENKTVTYAQYANGSSTINVEFEQIPVHIITWSVNGETSTTNVTDGNALVLPDIEPTSCDPTNYGTFVGWYTTAAGSDSNPSDAVGGTKAVASHIPTGDETYYAVWANGAAAGDFALVTNANQLSVGDVVTIASVAGNSQSGKVIKAYNSGNNWPTADVTTAANGKIAASTTDMQTFTLAAGTVDKTLAFYDGTGYIYAANTSNGTSNHMKRQTTLNEAGSFTIGIDGSTSKASVVSNGDVNSKNTIRYNGSNNPPIFSCYSGNQNDIYLYKQESGADKFISTCCTKHSITLDNEIENGSVAATETSACEGTSVTLTATGTENEGRFKTWSVTGMTLTNEQKATNSLTISMPDNNITVSATFDALYAITKVEEGGTITLGANYAAENDVVTISAVAKQDYEEPRVLKVYKTNDESTEITISNGSFVMPGYPVTAKVTYTASKTPLDPPTMGDNSNLTYNSVQLNWTNVANNSGYVLTVKQGEDVVEGYNAKVIDQNATSTVISGLEHLTAYTYSLYAKGDGVTYVAVNTAANGGFTTTDYPTVKIYYSENEVMRVAAGTDQKILTDFTLPSTANTGCTQKVLVGWTTAENAEYSHETDAPEGMLLPGATWQIPTNANCTLYAVYAKVTPETVSWSRVTTMSTLTDGGTFIMGYESTAKSGVLIPLRSADCGATTTANGYFNAGTSSTSSGSGTIDMSSVTSTSDYEVYISSPADGMINIQQSSSTGNYYGSSSTGSSKNTGRLYTTGNSDETNIIPEWSSEDNNQFKLRVNVSGDYKYLKYNTGDPRFAFYNSAGEKVVFYKKNVTPASTTKYATQCMAQVAKPVISDVTDGDTYEENKTVTITCETSDATIYYSIDGQNPATEYTEPFTLSDNGEYTIRAYATKTGMIDSDEADEVTVTIDKPFTSIEDLIKANLAENTSKKLSFTSESNAIITAVNSSNRYIQDASGYGIVIRSSNWDANAIQGKKITGTITGEWKVYEGQMQLDNSTFANMTFTAVDELPTATTVTALDETNFGEHPTALVKLESVTFASEEFSSRNVTINKGNTSYTLRDGVYVFGHMDNSTYVQDYDLPLSSTTCDVTGLLIRYTKNDNTTYQLVPVKVDGIDTKGADAVLPTFDAGSTDAANPAQVATGKNIGFTLETGFDAVYSVNDGVETAITNNTVVTISNTESATKLYVKASRDFYDDSEVTYYYIANPALAEHAITCATELPGGSISADKASAAVGEKVTLTATPDEDYHFVSWSVNGGDIAVDGNNQFDMPAGDVTVSASFAENAKATVQFAKGDNAATGTPPDNQVVYIGKNVTMPANTYSLSGKAFAGWKYGNTTYNVNQTYTITAADCEASPITFTAQWEPLPEWATVYTSNVTMSGATSSTVVIGGNEFPAMKAGTGNAAGSVNVTVPAHATTIHFHASGWDEREVTLNITAPTGITVTPASVNLIADVGASGNENTYTLQNDPATQAYFSVSLSGNTDEFTLNFANTGSKKQFILFGVNQVGGVVPVLDHITITGDLTNINYELGDELNMAGLTVTAYYTLAGVAHHSEDITSSVAWSYDPLTGGQTSVDVTATYQGQTDTQACTINPVVVPDPEIILSESELAFSGKQYSPVADQTFNVQLKNVAAATIALSGDDAAKFSIDKTSLTANGTITVSANTDAAGTFIATITVSDNAHDATSKTVALTLTVESDEAPAWAAEWVEATELYDGMPILITGVNSTTSKIYAMGAQGENNRAAVEGSLSGDVFTPGAGTKQFTLEKQNDGKYAIKTSTGQYLYAASSSKNYLRTQANNDANGKWTLSITSAVATGSNSHKTMQFNTSSTIFACYESTSQSAIKLYTPKTYTRNISGNIGTICLPNRVEEGDYFGATFYRVMYKKGDPVAPNYVQLEEVGALEAGRPYIFVPNDQENESVLRAIYRDKTAVANSEVNDTENHGLYGTFAGFDVDDEFDVNSDLIYILNSNMIRRCGTGCTIGENRAYIIMSEVPAENNQPASAPGRRQMSLFNGDRPVPTGVDEVTGDGLQVTGAQKVIINNHVYILRNGQMYGVDGKAVR